MNIPIELVATFLGCWMALQGWTLSELIKLKTKLAVLSQRVEDMQK
jgi:hypothetical protein